MKNSPLVSVVVPTLNSERSLAKCLRSVREQTYPHVELIVVDSYSNDNTIQIAETFSPKIVTIRERLLGARYRGLKESRGEYVLLLDSDQILEKTMIARALELMRENSMLCLEEHSYRPETWLQLLFEADRRLIHNLAEVQLDPIDGTMLARFYERQVLEEAFEAIPKRLMPLVVAHDHAIIYFEAYKISPKVEILPNAVWHVEPADIVSLWRKNYRYGKTTRELTELGLYRLLLQKKIRLRKRAFSNGNLAFGVSSTLLLFLKAIAYQVGYLRG